MKTRFLLYLLLLLIVTIIGIVRFKKLTIPFRLLTGLMAYTLASESLSRLLIKNNSPVYHLYIPVQFAFFTLIYADWSHRKRDFSLLIAVIFFFLALFNLNFLQSRFTFPSNTIMVSCCFFITLSLFQFKRMLLVVESNSIFRQSIFWLNAAVLIFFTVTFLYWGMYNYLLKNYIPTRPISTIVYYVNIVFYSMIAVSLLLDSNRKKVLNE